jgi:hypothetical protein
MLISPVGALLIILTIGYNKKCETTERSRKLAGTTQCGSPPETVGREAIHPPDAGMGEARRQAQGQRESEGQENEVNK